MTARTAPLRAWRGRSRVADAALDRAEAALPAGSEVFLVRTSGRVNLLGMHVDHRGGPVNPIAIREAAFVVRPRGDDAVRLFNAEPGPFPDRSFSISRELPEGAVSDWEGWTARSFEERRRRGEAGDWANYAKAPVLLLENRERAAGSGRRLRGFDLVAASDVPRAAGLSSSSSVVVGAALAASAANGLGIGPEEMAPICGEAEWYVGTRGGSGDHAAILLGRRGQVCHIGSDPFSVARLPLPPGASFVLANSLVEAKKTEGAKDGFNQRIACYEAGFMILQRCAPSLAGRAARLRDLLPDALGVGEAAIYGMLKALPARATRAGIRRLLPGREEALDRIFRSHGEPADGYPLRGVVLFGLAEIARSRRAPAVLGAGDLEGFSELARISQEGERVTRRSGTRRVSHRPSFADAEIDRWIADAAPLWRQPGGYAASIEEIDRIVETCLSTAGCLSARLVGAGLGGSVLALVRRGAEGRLIERLEREYYLPAGLAPAAEVVEPGDGAAILTPPA